MDGVTIMTTRTTHSVEHSSGRRDAEARQYSVYYAIGMVLFLPYVVATRLLPRTARSRALGSGTGDGSILQQTRAEVHNVLAFVFMA
jgi:hypothetical protein